MRENKIPFELPGFWIRNVEEGDNGLTIHAEARNPQATCPVCGAKTAHIHSNYTRAPQDLPVSGKRVHIVLGVRRFYCRNENCPRKIFCERVPEVIAVRAMRYVRHAFAAHLPASFDLHLDPTFLYR